jgi:hypothetical protein
MSETPSAGAANEQGSAEPVVAELVAPPPTPQELLQDVQRLREDNQRWRGRFVAACAAFVFLFIVAVIQFVGTFITLRLTHEGRLDAQRLQKQTLEAVKLVGDARQQLGTLEALEAVLNQQRDVLLSLKTRDAELQEQIAALRRERYEQERKLHEALKTIPAPSVPKDSQPKPDH